MPGTPQDVTEAELAVLRLLWESGPATIRQLTEALYPAVSASDYATVQKLLERLEAKGCVGRRRRQGAHVFRARIELGELIGRRLEDMADRLCEGSFAPLLTHLLRGDRLSPEERRSLRQLVAHLDQERGRRERRRK